MTPVQAQYHPPDADLVHRTAQDVMDAAGPQVCDDMSVEVALAVMAAARTGRLVVCDQDGHPTGLVTRTVLAAVRDGSAYTDRVRLRDVLGDHGSFALPLTTTAEAARAMRIRRFDAPSAADERDSAPGAPTPAR